MPLPENFLTKFGPWALVTGASSGIGAEFARQLAAAGLSVAITARRKERLDALASEISEKHSVSTRVIAADLETDEGIRAIVDGTADIDVGLLINNAGMETHGSFFRDSPELHMKIIRVNTMAPTALAHSIGRRLADRGKGGIINISSLSSRPVPWAATYSATKAYLTNLSLILREELALKGVAVTVVEPGPVESEMTANAEGIDWSKANMGMGLQSTADCVSESLQALSNNVPRMTPGFQGKIMSLVMKFMPHWLVMKLADASQRESFHPSLLEYT